MYKPYTNFTGYFGFSNISVLTQQYISSPGLGKAGPYAIDNVCYKDTKATMKQIDIFK